MEKVKLTQEQADEIELQKRELKSHDIVTRRIVSGLSNEDFMSIDLDTLVRALYIGYEVEPQFKVGDWVKDHDGNVFKIIHRGYNNHNFFADFRAIENGENTLIGTDHFAKHATPEEIAEEKERRWWEKYNRKLHEIRVGDILVDKYKSTFIVTEIDREKIKFPNFGWINKSDFINNKWKVACFAENREDVEHE